MSIGKAIMARTQEERDMWAGIEEAKMWAGRAIQCAVSRKLLDVKTVIAVEMPNGQTVVIHADVMPALQSAADETGQTIKVVCDGPALDEQRRAHQRAERAERAARKAQEAIPQP